MTDADYNLWLISQTSIRCVLVEADVTTGGSTITRYLSNTGYTTGAGDTPAHTYYKSVVTGGAKYTETLSLTGSTGLAFGDIEIINEDGKLDSWLDDVWRNRPVKVYIGDPRWARSDFRLVFNGVIDDIDSKNRDRLSLKMRDKLQRLNTPVTENKVGGTDTNKDVLKPLLFGECHNVEPLLLDPATHNYQVHDGLIERVIEVRDNGVPVTTTNTLSGGTFVLTQTPVGTITASVQGYKSGSVYSNTVSKLVQILATTYGKASDRFVSGDLDAANLAAFDAANTQPVGVYLKDRANVLQVCQTLANSIGAQLYMSRAGLLRLLRISFDGPSTFSIGQDDIYAGTLTPVKRQEVVASVKVGFCKNWTVQQGIQSGIPEDHKTLFGEEWLTTTQTDTGVATTYKLDAEPDQRDTSLLVEADAIAEALRELGIKKVPRTTYRFDGVPRLMQLELGQCVTLTNYRYGLSGGKLGVVTSLQPDWQKNRITVEVTV